MVVEHVAVELAAFTVDHVGVVLGEVLREQAAPPVVASIEVAVAPPGMAQIARLDGGNVVHRGPPDRDAGRRRQLLEVPREQRVGVLHPGDFAQAIALGLILLTIGGRLIPAGEVALITLLEIVLGPLWVWAFLAERPATATLVGGLVVLTAVLVQARSDTAPAVLP